MNLPYTLTVNQVAELLQVDPRTIRRNIDWGNIPAKKVGRIWRIPRTFVLTYLEPEGGNHAPNQSIESTYSSQTNGHC